MTKLFATFFIYGLHQEGFGKSGYIHVWAFCKVAGEHSDFTLDGASVCVR